MCRVPRFFARSVPFLHILLCLLLVISPLSGAQASDRDGEGNWPAYERTELLLAYEIMSLIKGASASLAFCQRRALIWAAIGHWLPLSL